MEPFGLKMELEKFTMGAEGSQSPKMEHNGARDSLKIDLEDWNHKVCSCALKTHLDDAT